MQLALVGLVDEGAQVRVERFGEQRRHGGNARRTPDHQKAGKKRMKSVGSVNIPQEAFLSILEQNE